ncbi:GerMN domain-containing protein [Halobacillus amylolyticus]|uniref:GerMN domain-containing protein n=1 Tax=Halobacillus amylolyticus TaxID=2932259 RepID=A0ABY4HCJ2_9BACI|nr:GerMN domain-containing protein [Halobacillus amylolyticus]UOR12118.1 GerMN domain-containing protein [Halobacillus amylolyticus]
MKTCGIKPLSIAVLLSTGLLSGCLFEGEQSLEEIDAPPEQETAANPETNTEEPAPEKGSGGESAEVEEGMEGEEATTETVARELFLIDSNGMVVPQTVELPASKEVATQSLEYLVKGGPISNLLPTGFEAVLPAGTQILGMNLKDNGTMVVDVSNEFKNYQPSEEQKILEAMTYTVTQFDNVDRMKLWINGHELKEMPVSGTPISGGVSRSDGINVQVGGNTDVVNSKAVTVYYPSQQSGQEVYQVPVTTRVSTEGELYTSLVQTLLEGPELGSSLQQPFNGEAEVTSAELTDGVLSVTFSEGLLNGQEPNAVAEPALASLVMSLTNMKEVEAVEVKVEGVEQVLNEAGEPLAEPVTRSDINGASEPESL